MPLFASRLSTLDWRMQAPLPRTEVWNMPLKQGLWVNLSERPRLIVSKTHFDTPGMASQAWLWVVRSQADTYTVAKRRIHWCWHGRLLSGRGHLETWSSSRAESFCQEVVHGLRQLLSRDRGVKESCLASVLELKNHQVGHCLRAGVSDSIPQPYRV